MDDVLEGLPAYMFIGILVVVGISQLHKLAGAVLGVVFWAATMVVGLEAYARGGALGLPGLPFPKSVFLGLCAFFVLIYVMRTVSAATSRKRASRRRSTDEPEGAPPSGNTPSDED